MQTFDVLMARGLLPTQFLVFSFSSSSSSFLFSSPVGRDHSGKQGRRFQPHPLAHSARHHLEPWVAAPGPSSSFLQEVGEGTGLPGVGRACLLAARAALPRGGGGPAGVLLGGPAQSVERVRSQRQARVFSSGPSSAAHCCVTQAGHWPSLGLSLHICTNGNIIPALPTSQGCCEELMR